MAWKNLCNEVEFLTQYPEVSLAISDSTAPVPGYLYGEINAITFIDYGRNCKPLVNFLVSRLDVNTPLISLKVLKLLLYLVRNGSSDIVEEVKFHEIPLKEAMGFHGPPDDLHGKSFYENIRMMAKELLEYVFSENREIRENVPPLSQSDCTGYGSNASVKKLPGFGYSVKSQKSVSEKVSEGITNFVEKLMPSSDGSPVPNEATHLSEALPRYKPLIIDKIIPDCEVILPESKSSSIQIVSVPQRVKQKISVYKPGRPGGGWDDSEDEEEELISDPIVEDVCKQSSASVDSIEFSKIELKEVAADWTDERKVVEEFTVNEDLRKLDYTVISSLCKRCSSLNCDKILSFLVEKFSENEENVQLRALIFVEYLLFHDIVTLESLLKIVSSAINNLVEKKDSIPVAVKIKAKKVGLIIQNLNKSYMQRHPKQFMETTPIKCGR